MIGAASATAIDEDAVIDDSDSVLAVSDDSESVATVSDEPILDAGTEEYYVNDTGDDSNVGSSDSPFASINKAISNLNSSNERTIYLSQGTFGSDNDSNFNININHVSNGGSLNFIGAGTDKTFIDGQSAFRFAYLSGGAVVTFKDITFINFKQGTGGTLWSNNCILTIENCVFKNSVATSEKGGAILCQNSMATLTVKNSQFIDCSVNGYNQYSYNPQGGGAIYAYNIKELYLENNTFVNTKICENRGNGVAILSAQSKSYIYNNKFINLNATSVSYDASIYINSENSVIANNTFINCSSPSKTYSIVGILYGSCLFENNTFINSTNDAGNVYVDGQGVSGLKFTMPNKVIDVGNAEINNGVEISYNVTDNMGNIVKTSSFTVNFVNENNSYAFTPSKNKIYFNTMPAIGIYNVTIKSGSDTTDVLTTADVHYSNDPIDIYVSPNGSDANEGNSSSSPFATISHAIDTGFDKSFTVIIHLLNGTYSGEGNVELDISGKGTLKILGEKYGETIIDGNNQNWFLNVNMEVLVENVTFANARPDCGYNIIDGNYHLTLVNCIVDKNTADEAYLLSNVYFDNLIFTNNHGEIYFGWGNDELVINNSYFANNHDMFGSYGVLYLSRENVVIENCKFINNTANTYAAAVYSSYGITSKNNYYYGNKARSDAVFYITDQMGQSTFDNDIFVNNQATDGNYAIVGVNGRGDSFPHYNFNNCRFINNSAKKGVVGLIQGSIVGCSFINNTADYGAAIVIIPLALDSYFFEDPDMLEMIFMQYGLEDINITDVTFENNIATLNGNDLYLDTPDNLYSGQVCYFKFISLDVKFNDKNVTALSDTLTGTVTGPCGAVVGGRSVTFELNGNEIGSAEIQNGIISLDYDGFNDGVYTLNGTSEFKGNVQSATVNVKLEGVVDHNEVWVSATGSDETGNGSETNPFASISYAVTQATKNCRDVVIHIGEGTYTGESNTALKLSAVNNITLIGAGPDKTIIDGQNTTYFAKIASGLNEIVISGLTIKNMLPDNRESRTIDNTMVPITIDSGATVYLYDVAITNNHGGSAIIENDGNLFIENSVISYNGIATYIIHGGNTTIYNTLFEANFAQTAIIYSDLVISDSKLINQFVFTKFSVISGDILGSHAIIENALIYNDGDNSSLSLLGIEKVVTTMNPAVAVTSSDVYMNNVTMINDFKSKVYEYQYSYGDGSQLAPFGYLYGSTGKTIEVYNSTFANYKFIWCVNTYGMLNFTFDGCVFENLTMIAQSQTANLEGTEGENSLFKISNSVFINTDPAIDRQNRGDRPNPVCDFNDNYWGNNSKPVVTFVNPGKNQNKTYEPETWIILTTEDDELVFKVTDGENTTAYEGTLPAEISYVADETGNVIPVVNINGDGYVLAADEEGNLMINASAAPIKDIEPLVAVNETVFANNISLKIGEAAVFTANFTDKWGIPLKNTNVSFIIGETTITKTTDANGTASFDIDFGLGTYTVDITNPATSQSISRSIDITTDDTIAASDVAATVGDGSKFSATFTDQYGKALANTNVTFKVGNNTINAITDVNGTASFVIDFNAGVYTVVITNPVTAQSLSKTITVTVAETISAVDVTATYGDAVKFSATFTDKFGKALANTNVTFKVGNNTINATTDVNGTASFAIDFNAGVYNVTVTNPVTSQVTTKAITINKLATTLTAAKVTTTYNVAKNLVVTLKDANGKALANTNVILNINGKQVPLTTDKDGNAKYSVKLPAKTYTATVTYAGDDNYAKSTVDAKVVVNKAKVKLTAKKKTFKAKVKVKKYTVTLKDNKGKAMKKVKLTLTIKKKKFTAKTNKKGKATFKIKKLSKKGKHTAKVTFKGNKNFKKVTKKVKITVKK